MVWFDGVKSNSLWTDSGKWRRRRTKLAEAALEIWASLRIDLRVFSIPRGEEIRGSAGDDLLSHRREGGPCREGHPRDQSGCA
jgi:hypothetical protein